jgi:hypothetical protein
MLETAAADASQNTTDRGENSSSYAVYSSTQADQLLILLISCF